MRTHVSILTNMTYSDMHRWCHMTCVSACGMWHHWRMSQCCILMSFSLFAHHAYGTIGKICVMLNFQKCSSGINIVIWVMRRWCAHMRDDQSHLAKNKMSAYAVNSKSHLAHDTIGACHMSTFEKLASRIFGQWCHMRDVQK